MRTLSTSIAIYPGDQPTVNIFPGSNNVQIVAGDIYLYAFKPDSPSTTAEKLDILDAWVAHLAHELTGARTRLNTTGTRNQTAAFESWGL